MTDCTRVSYGAPASVHRPRMQSRGRSPRTIGRREGTAPAVSYAAEYVSRPTVGGGVLDAPCLRDRRAALYASVWHDRQHPRHSRCARLRPPPNASNPTGTARAPFYTGAPTFPIIPRREGVEALPYGIVGTFRRETAVVRRPKAGRRGRRPLRAVAQRRYPHRGKQMRKRRKPPPTPRLP